MYVRTRIRVHGPPVEERINVLEAIALASMNKRRTLHYCTGQNYIVHMIGRAGVLQECVHCVEAAIGPPRNERKEGRKKRRKSIRRNNSNCRVCRDICKRFDICISLQGIINHFESWAAGMGVSLKHPALCGTLWVYDAAIAICGGENAANRPPFIINDAVER